MGIRRLWTLGALAAFAWTGGARADGDPIPAAAPPVSAEATRAALAASYASKPSWRGARDLAEAELAAGLAPEGATHLGEALSLLPKIHDAADEAALRARLAEAKKDVATLVIRAHARGVSLSLDGVDLGTVQGGPSAFMRLVYAAPGEHAVVARFDGQIVFEDVRSVEAGASTLFDVVGEAGSRDDKPLWPAFVLGGIAALGVGTGIGLVVASVSKEGEADDLAATIPRCDLDAPSAACGALGSIIASRNDLRDGSSIAFVIGGIAAASTVAYLLVPTGEEPEGTAARLWVAPAFGPGVARLSLGGQFR